MLSVTSLDYNHDNIPEIVICTQKGVYIYTISKDYIIQLLSANKEFVEWVNALAECSFVETNAYLSLSNYIQFEDE